VIGDQRARGRAGGGAEMKLGAGMCCENRSSRRNCLKRFESDSRERGASRAQWADADRKRFCPRYRSANCNCWKMIVNGKANKVIAQEPEYFGKDSGKSSGEFDGQERAANGPDLVRMSAVAGIDCTSDVAG